MVDIDEVDDVALEHGITAIPVIMKFEKGKPGEKLSMCSEETVRKFIG